MKTIITRCTVCSKRLTGKQRKFCSAKCHNAAGNLFYQKYDRQRQRGIERKMILVKDKGSQCMECGYKKNHAALTFHHRDPKEKLFELDLRGCANRSWGELQSESQKCDLLCHNCHIELHNPDSFL